MSTKSLLVQQLNNKMMAYNNLKQAAIPPTGWVKAIRTALGMSMQQLGAKLAITKQGVLEIEKREKEGSITIKSLKEIGSALDMQLVYGFVPKDNTIDALIERKAIELATKIVQRTSNTMKLEDQENSKERLEKAIQERVGIIKNEMPKILWD